METKKPVDYFINHTFNSEFKSNNQLEQFSFTGDELYHI